MTDCYICYMTVCNCYITGIYMLYNSDMSVNITVKYVI